MKDFVIRSLSLSCLALAASAADRLGPLPAAAPPPAAAAATAAAPAPAVTPASTAPAMSASGNTRAAPDELEPGVRTSSSASPRGGGSLDRVELENTQITGNRELPRVMYVVPWKKPELGDLGGRPAKSLLEELLEPVDRNVFQRQVRYYGVLQPDAAGKPSPAAPAAATGEK